MYNYKLSDYQDDLQEVGITNETDMIAIMDYLYTLAEIGVEYVKINENINLNDKSE